MDLQVVEDIVKGRLRRPCDGLDGEPGLFLRRLPD
jgi:hypothetical protein